MFLYNLIILKIFITVILFSPILILFKKYRTELVQRLRVPRIGLKSGKRILIHCSSVGELNSVTNLITEISRRGFEVVISTFTQSGLNTAKGLKETSVILPFDLNFLMRKFFKNIEPDLLIIVESEFWPNLIHCAKDLDIPVLAVNARITEKILKRYQVIRKFISKRLNDIHRIFVQNNEYHDRFLSLGVKAQNLIVSGNTKYDRFLNLVLKEEKKHFEIIDMDCKTVVVGSLREGEEELIINAIRRFKSLRTNFVIAPRHIDYSKKLIIKFSRANLKAHLFSNKKEIRNDSIMVVDAMGHLLELYSLCDIAIVGGAFENYGGQNVLEPVYFNKPVITGPNYFNFKSEVKLLLDNNLIFITSNADELHKRLTTLLNEGVNLETFKKGREVILQNTGTTEKIISYINILLIKSQFCGQGSNYHSY